MAESQPPEGLQVKIRNAVDIAGRDSLHDALTAALDLHQPMEITLVSVSEGGGDWRDVAVKGDDGEYVSLEPPEIRCSCTGQGMLPYPCPTSLIVAAALGVPLPVSSTEEEPTDRD